MDEDTTYDIYLHDDRTLNLETNLEAALSNNISRDKQIKVLLLFRPKLTGMCLRVRVEIGKIA